MSDWHFFDKQERYFRKQEMKASGFMRFFASKMVALAITGKRWIAEDQEDRINWDD